MAIWDPTRKPTWTEHELIDGSVTIGKCSECGALLTQAYCSNPDEANLRMDALFEDHVKERHSPG